MDPEQYAATAEFYDYVVPYQTRQDVAFFVEAAQASGGPVLEIGCGTGRVLIPTARAGIAITGIDLSPHMLDVCQRRLAQEPAEVQARVQIDQADMRDFALGQAFKLITLPFRPFQHLIEVADQIACLRCVHKHLAADGRFILDVFNPFLPALAREVGGEEQDDGGEFTMPDGRRVQRRSRVVKRDVFKQYQDVELIYYITHPAGRTERLVHAFPMRYLFRYEVEHLLARCGFAVEALYADYDKRPFGSTTPGELIFVARKRGE
ncbi:Cypemycin N-terminal methyltransferase [Thermoflexales bacterium]|nr:Cypemycin N-terminal methyltransferase [Thermoflexales bacterium]